jgi:aspartate racemase
MADLVERRGVEAIVLGCTEIGLLVDETDATVPLVDTTVEQVRAAVDWALAP